MAIDIGRIAYEKWQSCLPKDYPTSAWEMVGKVQQDAWRAAAVAVLQYIDKERESLDIVE